MFCLFQTNNLDPLFARSQLSLAGVVVVMHNHPPVTIHNAPHRGPVVVIPRSVDTGSLSKHRVIRMVLPGCMGRHRGGWCPRSGRWRVAAECVAVQPGRLFEKPFLYSKSILIIDLATPCFERCSMYLSS